MNETQETATPIEESAPVNPEPQAGAEAAVPQEGEPYDGQTA